MKNWYIIINKTNSKLLGVNGIEYDRLEIYCVWNMSSKKEIELILRKNNCFSLYKVVSHKKYVELRGEL